MNAGDGFQRPHPNTQRCADCGHVWFEGERRHEYAGESGEISVEDDAEAVCRLCLHKRRRKAPADDGDEVSYW
ncbi:MAG: hypothetical protein H0W96_00460 [Solirubrobacterales bacterium]|nr:hypothetical protein [Solirubrobacterales bacterium]